MLTATRPLVARLARLDRALASRDGLSVRSFARDQECSRRTVQRDMDLIRHSLGLSLDFDGRVWRYAEGSGPIFSGVVHADCL